MENNAKSGLTFEEWRTKDAPPKLGSEITRKMFWLNAYTALLHQNLPQEAATLADVALELAITRWENAPGRKVQLMVVEFDLPI